MASRMEVEARMEEGSMDEGSCSGSSSGGSAAAANLPAARPDLPRTGSALEAEKIRGSFQRPRVWMLVAGALLATCAGIVNVTALLEYEVVVTHVTGHATAVGMRLEGLRLKHGVDLDGDLGVQSALGSTNYSTHVDKFQEAVAILCSFIFGAFLCGLVIPKNALHFGGKSFYGVALLGNSALLVLAAVLSRPGFDLLPACIAACAAGLQNAMCTMHFGAVVRTTHLTGTSTDIGSTSGRAAMILMRSRCSRRRMPKTDRAELAVDLEKLQILTMLLLCFILGNFLGALAFSRLGVWTLLLAAAVTGSMGFAYTLFREALKRNLKGFERSRMASMRQRVREALALRRKQQGEAPEGAQRQQTLEAIAEEEDILADLEEFCDLCEHEAEEDRERARCQQAGHGRGTAQV